jgi:D-alanine transaminase
MIYLNGQYMPMEEARIPVLDRGFIFGDGIYEYIPVFDRAPFRLSEHYRRMVRSLAEVKIPNPFDEAAFIAVVDKLVAAHPWDNQGVYVHITRGVAPRDHAFPKDIKPTVFIMSNPLALPSKEQVENGLAVSVREDIRWLRCDIKSISLLGHCMLRSEAAEEGSAEVILVRNGFLTEASASNVLIVKDGTVLCPPRDNLILPGISYDVVLELLREHGIRHEVRPVTEAELRGAEEVWLTSSTKDVLAVTRMDGRPVGSGKPGPVFARIRPLFTAMKTRMKAASHV